MSSPVQTNAPQEPASFDAQQETLSDIHFVEELKTSRLGMLARLIIFASLMSLVIFLTVIRELDLDQQKVIGIIAVQISSALAGWAVMVGLSRYPYRVLARTFIGIMLVIINLILVIVGQDSLAHFIFPIIVFIASLLLSPRNTAITGLIALASILFTPMLFHGVQGLNSIQVIASATTLLSIGIAILMTGDLYKVAEWSLDNYHKERQTNQKLYDKRQELQYSLERAKSLSEELQASNDDLQIARAEAEDAKTFRGQFLANMSHELRTPLNAIIGFSETMLNYPIMYDDTVLPSEYERDLRQVYDSGRHLLHILNDIIDLAKVDAGKLEVRMGRVETVPIVKAVVATATGLLGKKPVKLVLDFTEPLPDVWADENRLRQVLLNLYSNACKYTDAGTITLHIQSYPEDAHYLQFALQDTGIGIAKADQEKLFQEFQQVQAGGRDPRTGSGLGLAITRQLLHLMNGRVWATSMLNEGSTFYFIVQKYDPESQQLAQ